MSSERFGEKNAIGGLLRSVFASRSSIDGRIDVDLITEVGSLIYRQLPPHVSVS
jgi:hypothetical protein